MADADQLKIQTTLAAVAGLVEEGEVQLLTDGHTFTVRDSAQAAEYLERLLDQATRLQGAALALTEDGEPVRPSVFVERYSDSVAELGVGGANPNVMFTGMMSVNQLGEIGLRPQSSGMDAPWSRPAMLNPAPVEGRPRGIALIPAVLAMVGWKVRRLDR